MKNKCECTGATESSEVGVHQATRSGVKKVCTVQRGERWDGGRRECAEIREGGGEVEVRDGD
ncbi:hypothetical protein PMAC_003396 [Pneumocystis sp. 'macacae']|nr:hypothetical protein PMAC_003396 [Pneumocystis sp. 'macacae']